jgi:hypothetical protein
MRYLYDSFGVAIACIDNGRLYNSDGRHTGHYIAQHEILVDLSGGYLADIVADNRLLVDIRTPFKLMNFGAYGIDDRPHDFVQPPEIEAMTPPDGHVDLSIAPAFEPLVVDDAYLLALPGGAEPGRIKIA